MRNGEVGMVGPNHRWGSAFAVGMQNVQAMERKNAIGDRIMLGHLTHRDLTDTKAPDFSEHVLVSTSLIHM